MCTNSTEELVIQATEQYGFNLEFKTSKALEENGWKCELNKLFPRKDCSFAEVDIIATKENLRLVIECKGAEKDSVLILIKNSKSNGNDRQHYEIGYYTKIPNFIQSKAPQTISGDFFGPKTENKTQKLIKKSKNDNQNNFYKAQQQILEAITLYANELNSPKNVNYICSLPSTEYHNNYLLIPLIVTNAEIWVVDYTNEKNPVQKFKGAIQRVINDKYAINIPADSNKYTKSIEVPVITHEHIKTVLDEISKLSDHSDFSRWLASHNKISLDFQLT